MAFDTLGLSENVLTAVRNSGYDHPTPIQEQAIPLILENRDVIGASQTGTGKTAAFALPLLSLMEAGHQGPQTLVLCPTRELAIQVSEAFQAYAKGMDDFHGLPIYGGADMRNQLRGLKQNPQVIVGTPGRVIDHMKRGTLDLSGLRVAVLDEGDQMLDIGFLPGEGGRDTVSILDGAEKGELETVLLLGADEIDTGKLGEAFVIYVGHHGDAGAMRADLILPSAAYTEKNGLYVNTEGRVQMGARAVFPKGEAKEDWAIFRALSARLNKTLPYDDLNTLRMKLIEEHPTFGEIDHAPGAATAADFDPAKLGEAGDVKDEPFVSPITDFYLTNPIARASKTLAECSAMVADARAELQAAE